MAKAEMNSIKENRERKEAVEKLQKEVNTDLLMECYNSIPKLSISYLFWFTFFLYYKGRKKWRI